MQRPSSESQNDSNFAHWFIKLTWYVTKLSEKPTSDVGDIQEPCIKKSQHGGYDAYTS